jgi:hypothetical protein
MVKVMVSLKMLGVNFHYGGRFHQTVNVVRTVKSGSLEPCFVAASRISYSPVLDWMKATQDSDSLKGILPCGTGRGDVGDANDVGDVCGERCPDATSCRYCRL